MFDTTHNTDVVLKACPEAATKESPVRVAIKGQVVYLRPSNVLRMEVRNAFAGHKNRVIVFLSDGEQYVFSNADASDADTVAVLLWPNKTHGMVLANNKVLA